ncbi:glycoside hydrolase family 25 protein [Amycolatopsis halotolerans]|uniref:Glycoside hydrolase family 25 protein n=1 Tax=Amycolatopsis halotolerans TaxID=330083 RepID=A0ABV7QXD2_9PSEU
MDITFAVDISHHQDKSLSLARTRADGCELAILKAGEGSSFVDPDFASNLQEARDAGQLIAAYWYQRANASAAQHVAKIKAVVPRDVAVIMDVEANGGNVVLTREILRLLQAEGYRTPFVYIPRWYWQQLGSPSLAGLPPLWSSRYPDNLVGTLSSEWSQVPASYWNGYGGAEVGLLQFTSSARIGGYAPLDASAFRGTRAQLAALIGGSAAPLTQETEDDDMAVQAKATCEPDGHGTLTGDDFVSVPCNGKGGLFIGTHYGRRVKILGVTGICDTGASPQYKEIKIANYIDPDKPGPVGLPSGIRTVSLRYAADHEFTAWCA